MLDGLKKRARDAVVKLSELAENAVDRLDPKAKRKPAPAPAKPGPKATKATAPVEAAPVMIYLDWNSKADLKRLTDVLRSAEIPWQEIDVENDESTRSWVRAKTGHGELPVLFIAGDLIGGVQEVVQADVRGELKRKVFGG